MKFDLSTRASWSTPAERACPVCTKRFVPAAVPFAAYVELTPAQHAAHPEALKDDAKRNTFTARLAPACDACAAEHAPAQHGAAALLNTMHEAQIVAAVPPEVAAALAIPASNPEHADVQRAVRGAYARGLCALAGDGGPRFGGVAHETGRWDWLFASERERAWIEPVVTHALMAALARAARAPAAPAPLPNLDLDPERLPHCRACKGVAGRCPCPPFAADGGSNAVAQPMCELHGYDWQAACDECVAEIKRFQARMGDA